MTHHNYAGCEEPLCQSCEGYSAGYVAGRSKALFEVSTRTTHRAAGCGCDPCQAVSGRLRRRADLQEALDPDRTSGDELERDRSALPASLQMELALLLGIELSDGGLL